MLHRISLGWLTPKPMPLCNKHDPPIPKGWVGHTKSRLICLTCHATYQRRWRATHREHVNEYAKLYQRKRYHEVKPSTRPQPPGPVPSCPLGHAKTWVMWPSGSQYYCRTCGRENNRRRRTERRADLVEAERVRQRDRERGRLNRAVKQVAAQRAQGSG